MPGIPGAGGPPPKRSDQRRRTNSPGTQTAPAGDEPTIPDADLEWHPVARMWFQSLACSGQSQFYEASDWATAYLIAEAMSRELNPQPIVIGRGESAEVEMHNLPPKGASLAAWLKAMTSLLVTEGDRRRLRLELERQGPAESEGGADVSELDEYRRRLQSG